ncbi:MAG: DUF1491 family protein [Hyphomicrobiales bacterium]|nr:DUF1491 family protein [Hyphomicrobiales bacterium]
MRIKSEFWVKAYVRRMAGQGAFATLIKRGDEDYGAVLVLVRHQDGTAALFGPAPTQGGPGIEGAERRFVRLHATPAVSEDEAGTILDRQRRFDADAWVVEVEDRAGRHGLDLAEDHD